MKAGHTPVRNEITRRTFLGGGARERRACGGRSCVRSATATCATSASGQGPDRVARHGPAELEYAEIEGCGDIANLRGEHRMTIPVEGGEPIVDVGKLLEVRRRGRHGSWMVVRDVFSSDLPLRRPNSAEGDQR